MLGLLQAGLRAEFELRIDDARSAYERAHAADPADAVAARFLAEFHRHHTGDWVLARQLFAEILARPADPISRAVALHGLGKMTIHDGDFARGVAMFEQSVAAFPLPLTYRNLAVYWNSEGTRRQGLRLRREGPGARPRRPLQPGFFAATYFVGQGKSEAAERSRGRTSRCSPPRTTWRRSRRSWAERRRRSSS